MPRVSGSKVLTLKTRAEFQRIRGGNKWGTRGFMLEAKPRITVSLGARPGDGALPPRFGLTITKKIGIAVERNRIRRRIKEAIRQLQDEFAEPNTDYVLIARRAALECDFAGLVKDLQDALQRVHSRSKSSARPADKPGRAPKQH